jgi:VWFA-related protein
MAVLFLATVPVVAQNQGPLYNIHKEQVVKQDRSEDRIYAARRPDRNGKPTLYISVQFKIAYADGQPANDVLPEEIVVKENGRRVTEVEVHSPAEPEPLTTVLAIDISGSMRERGKLEEAKEAARQFLKRLDRKSTCGLILFDHALRVLERPSSDRQRLLTHIDAAQPQGGTAYLDATAQAIEMVKMVQGRRAVLVMTDGVDLNSSSKLTEVIRQAQDAKVPVYTIGVGEPGKNEPVTTVLVLDHSGSMDDFIGTGDKVKKIDALHRAAARFVDIMRPGARTTLLPFNDVPQIPKPFGTDKKALKETIQQLQPEGETALFDATYDAVATLTAARPEGKRAVVVMTDGINNRGHRGKDEVIRRAIADKIPLYMLGFGREEELDEKVMKEMAERTGGTYGHAESGQKLYEIFEDLSIQLHDDGVDEAALKKLAEETGGKYYSARDISRLRFIYEGLAQELQTTYTVTFPSLRQDDDGTARDIDISVWRNGVQVSDVLRGAYNRPGVVVPEMDHRVYLGLLAGLGGLLLLPAGLRRLSRRQVEA